MTAAASTANCRRTTGSPSSAARPGRAYLHLFDKAQPDVNWKNPDIHEEFKKTLRFWSDHGTDGFRIDVAHGLAKDLESKPLEELGREYSVVGVLNHDFSHPLFDRREVHDIYREWRKVFNEYTPPRFAVAEAWVVPEHQHLYASMDELGQSFNFDFAQANWYADESRKAIAAGLKAAAETGGSTMTCRAAPPAMVCRRPRARRITSCHTTGCCATAPPTRRTANSAPAVPVPPR